MTSAGHRTAVPLRVRFSETDAMGVANNAAYLAWFEVGRVEYLREIGHSYADVHSGGMDMVVVEARISYLRALRFDDTFTVECTCTSVRGASFTFGYELRDARGVCTRGETRHACVDRERMRPVRVPDWLVQAVSAAS
jgi:acyl-CoA thioester hydrolase